MNSKVIAFSLVLAMFSLNAQEFDIGTKRRKITVEDAVESALKTHVSILREEIALDQTKRDSEHAWNKFLPSISVDGNVMENNSLTESDAKNLITSAGISASLRISSSVGYDIKLLREKYLAKENSYEDTVRSIEATVRKAFYNLLYLRESMEVSEQSVASYQRQYDQTKEKQRRGLVPELDLLTAQVNLESEKPKFENAKITYYNALREFCDTIGIDEPCDLEGSLDFAESAKKIDLSVLDSVVANSSEVRKLNEQITQANLTKKSASAQSLPSLTLSATVNPWYNTYNWKSKTDIDNQTWSASIGLSIPIDSWIPGSSTRDNVKVADDTIRDLELQLADKKKTVVTEAGSKLASIEQSMQTMNALKMNVELAEKSYNLTEDAYRHGTKDLLTLQTAQDKYNSVQLQLRSEQCTLISNILDFENTIGVDFDTYFEK